MESSYSLKKFQLKHGSPDKLCIDFEECKESAEVFETISDRAKELSEIEKFINITQILEKKIGCVPIIYQVKGSKVTTQYLGTQTLLSLACDSGKYGILLNTLDDAIQWIVKLSKLELEDNQNSFVIQERLFCSKAMMKEMEKFVLVTGNQSCLMEWFEECINSIFASQSYVPCHRDFQSANIMRSNEGKTYAIDYQDMCMGLLLYDLASLLYDLKIVLPEIERDRLSTKYYESMEKAGMINKWNKDEFLYNLRLTGFLRLCKSLTLRFKRNLTNEIYRGLFLLRILAIQLKPRNNTPWKIYEKICGSFSDSFSDSDLEIIILGAGQGKRMGGDLPKVLQPCLGIPMLDYVLRIGILLAPEMIYLVKGYKGELIDNHLSYFYDDHVQLVTQKERLGTGHAVMQVAPFLKPGKYVIVMAGDVPVLDFNTMNNYISKFKDMDCPAGILTTRAENPHGFGRIIRDSEGKFMGTIEQKDIPNDRPDLEEIKEISAGILIFRSSDLIEKLGKIDNNNAQKEYYLPDVINLLLKEGKEIMVYLEPKIPEVHGANNPQQLAEIEKWMSVD